MSVCFSEKGILQPVTHSNSQSSSSSLTSSFPNSDVLQQIPALQDHYAPKNACFGCGPANAQGLQVKSRVLGQQVFAEWHPQTHHEAFPGVLNGGIIGALLDCHSNWTAAWHLMNQQGADHPPCTVTADYSIQLLRPTPTQAGVIQLQAQVAEAVGPDRVRIQATLAVDGKVCARCTGLFVAVRPGHPAYHRW
jgi:acyl-coenzyme A thioesterase PaaI-like protein